MDGLTVELNVALVPDGDLARRLAAVSRDFARRYPAVMLLGDGSARLSLAPHLTLYQVPVPLAELPQLHVGLAKVAREMGPARLDCTGLAYNWEDASLEARTDVSADLLALQADVIALANPLRGSLLLERDPAGRPVENLLRVPGRLGGNIRRTGYGEVGDPRDGGLFRPHVTLNWFQPGTLVELEREPLAADYASLSGEYPALGAFALGPYGTCAQLLARYELGRLPELKWRVTDGTGPAGPAG